MKAFKHTIILVMIALALGMTWFSNDTRTYSASGSMELLRGSGNLNIYGGYLFYSSKDLEYSKSELRALTVLSKHYKIIL